VPSRDWIRRSPRYWTRCSKRHGGCGNEISPSSETAWMLPPGKSTRLRFYFLCGRCASKVGLPLPVGEQVAPVTFQWDASKWQDVKTLQLPPGDRD
jgi:hypothetical protein